MNTRKKKQGEEKKGRNFNTYSRLTPVDKNNNLFEEKEIKI